jgi:hypothetical protein
MKRVGASRASRRDGEHIVERERHEDRVQVVKPIVSATDDGQCQVQLRRREPDDWGVVGGVGHEPR